MVKRQRPKNYDQWMAARTTHGEYCGGKESPEHYIWRTMLRRKEGRNGHYYVGIQVCERWQKFEAFLADMGRRPTPDHQLDRRDNNGHYEPGNCRWVLRSVQQKNKRNTRHYEWQGKQLTPSELAEALGISRALLSYRLRRGQYVDARV